ncbi:MAG TPA: crosslink repair DNA glycosylase YcaQ family protein [Acidimicrobiia bacterium]
MAHGVAGWYGMLELTRTQMLSFRRRVGTLDGRLPSGVGSLRQAAWAGMQDSVPRAALLSIHARVERTQPDAWEDPSLVQVWGPRWNAYVVPARDLGIFTLGRLPEEGALRRRGEDLASRLRSLLGDEAMTYSWAARELGVHPSQLRYAGPTGTILLRWDGAHQPVIRSVAPPAVEPSQARLELARRFLHVFGPSTRASFAVWAGIPAKTAVGTFDAIGNELLEVGTPFGPAWILDSDEESIRAAPGPEAPARLLPSGDAYFLLKGHDRELLVESAPDRFELWPSRVWPGALMVEGEIVGTWRRSQHKVAVRAWRRLPAHARDAVELEAAGLPLPGIDREMAITWES